MLAGAGVWISAILGSAMNSVPAFSGRRRSLPPDTSILIERVAVTAVVSAARAENSPGEQLNPKAVTKANRSENRLLRHPSRRSIFGSPSIRLKHFLARID